MLTPRQNFLETIRGGKPDRIVNQFEYLTVIMDPILLNTAGFTAPGTTRVTDWGFTVTWPDGTPGPFPIHTPDKVLLKDITQWREVLKAPDPRSYPEEAWAPVVEAANAVDRSQTFVTTMIITGLFEKLHWFMGMEEALMALLEEPDECKALVDWLADWEIECAKVQIEHVHPDAILHHDDFGSQLSSFMSPETFNEIFVPAYKKLYKFWKDNGVEVVIHHSDSYCANLIEGMIEMGIDVFQGALITNNIPELLKKYGPQIAIHGGIGNGIYDTADWTEEKLRAGLEELIEQTGTMYFIPGFTAGGPGATFPGVYDALSYEIDKLSEKYFPGFSAESTGRRATESVIDEISEAI